MSRRPRPAAQAAGYIGAKPPFGGSLWIGSYFPCEFGILTANVAAYFVESKEADANAELQHKLDQVLERLAAIEAAQSAPTDSRQEWEVFVGPRCEYLVSDASPSRNNANLI